MDSGAIELKQTVIDKLRHNGTLDRIQKTIIYSKTQAELRYAIFLALESNENNELEISRNELDMRSGYSVIYHFLRQNRFLATAAVFEKEMHQEIISLEELKKDDTTKFYFQLFGDTTITLTKSVKENSIPDCRIVNSDSENKREGSGQKVRGWDVSEIKKNEINDIDSNAASSRERNPNNEEVEKQRMSQSDSNSTLKSVTSHSEISSSANETPKRKEKLDGKTDDEKRRKCNERSSRSSRSPVSEQQQQETPKESSIKYQISSYPRKLPPITSTRNETIASKRLPAIPSLNNASSHTGTTLLQRLDTILNSPLSDKHETDEDIVEEIIIDELLQSNNSDDTNSF
uniref:LisH domain-containing protein n=1 Tax=Setaria digitata TaxID=48799 RepID=A0A915Q804_9BILA